MPSSVLWPKLAEALSVSRIARQAAVADTGGCVVYRHHGEPSAGACGVEELQVNVRSSRSARMRVNVS